MQRLRKYSLIAMLFVLPACNGTCSYGFLHSDIVLRSGERLKVVQFRKTFTDGKPSQVELVYETALAVEDNSPLRDEVREVWLVFRPEVDSLGFNRAIIVAQKTTSVLLARQTKSESYVFQKEADGTWSF